MKKTILSIICILTICGFIACGNKHKQSMEGTVLLLETSMGDIRIRLYDDTPKHRDNIVKLAKEGFYDGTLFHRVIKDFMIQAGDPKSKNASDTATLGSGDTGYTIPAEFVYPKYFHRRGSWPQHVWETTSIPSKNHPAASSTLLPEKKFTEEELAALESQLNQQQLQAAFNRMARQHMKDIFKMRKANDTLGLKNWKTPYSNKPNRKCSPTCSASTTNKRKLYHNGRSTSSGRAIHRVR